MASSPSSYTMSVGATPVTNGEVPRLQGEPCTHSPSVCSFTKGCDCKGRGTPILALPSPSPPAGAGKGALWASHSLQPGVTLTPMGLGLCQGTPQP